jgi:hypothetical protein
VKVDQVALKEKLKMMRLRRTRVVTPDLVPRHMKALYVSILKRGYIAEWRESALSPGTYIVDLYEQFERPPDALYPGKREFLRESIMLKPKSSRNSRF